MVGKKKKWGEGRGTTSVKHEVREKKKKSGGKFREGDTSSRGVSLGRECGVILLIVRGGKRCTLEDV